MNHYIAGRKLLDQGKIEAALEQFQYGYDQGDPHCAYGLLAIDAMSGKDRTESIARLTISLPKIIESADNHNQEACFILGRCYETGSAVEKNLANAMIYYGKAAAKGHADAQFNLGCIHMTKGLENSSLAIKYFTDAAKQGHPEACRALEYYYNSQGATKKSQ